LAQPPASDALLEETVALVRKHGSISAAATAEGISRQTFQGRVAKARQRWPGCLPPGSFDHSKPWVTEDDKPRIRAKAIRGEIGGPPIPPIALPPEGFVISRNAGQYDAEGNLQKQWIETKRGGLEVYEPPIGHTIKGESVLLDGTGIVTARWVKTKFEQGAGLIEGLRAAFAEYEGGAGVILAPEGADEDTLTVYPLPDLHLGLLAWGAETGQDYDLHIATATAISSLEKLVERSLPSKHAVLLGLGDFYHGDDQKNVTPGSGHQLDVDGRHAKIFAAGAKLAVRMVEIIARKHPNIEIRFLSGNHDINASMCLTVALSMFYSGNERISVNCDPGIAWYRLHGKVLLGATHGHSARMERLPGMMAADRPVEWGKSLHRSFLTGHIHTETVREVAGVRVESLQAPAARDAWNAASGYRSGRSLSAITYHAEEGEIGRHRVNLFARGTA
jgi:hypothetical protein